VTAVPRDCGGHRATGTGLRKSDEKVAEGYKHLSEKKKKVYGKEKTLASSIAVEVVA